MENLLVKYRPLKLTDVLGQPEIVRALQLWLKEPYSCGFLFHGESGVGKTSAAIALANELGCDVAEEELGGLFSIASGEQTADSVRDMLDHLRYRPLCGSGWRMLVVNESDIMSRAAETIWLDGLEKLRPQCVVIFTTNAPQKLSARFRGRCKSYAFESESHLLSPVIRDMARRVWKAEVPRVPPPSFDGLGLPTVLDRLDGLHASFRLALQQLGELVLEAKHGDPAKVKKVQKRMKRDHLVTADKVEAACDHCGETNDVVKGDGVDEV